MMVVDAPVLSPSQSRGRQAIAAARLVFASCMRAVRPRARLSVSEWADANRMLSLTGSAEPGRWKTSRTPYLREIMDTLSEQNPARKVVFKKSSQVGGTEAASNWLGYIMCHAKGPVAVVMPTEKSLTDWMSQKFEPMATETPAIASVLASRSNRSADNNAQRKKFVGGILYAKTAGSTTELKSTSLRYAIADEVDEYDWATLQGDPIGLLDVRLTTYHDRKLFIVSSPTLRDASRIDELFEGGDRRRYHVPCPHCGHAQHLRWSNLQWSKPLPGQRHIGAAWYVCEDCGAEIPEHHKGSMLERGAWVPEAPGAPYPSFHINALYSPAGLGLTWAELASEWIEAQEDPAKLMRFVNTRLGETWADRSRDLKPNALLARAEPYQLRTVPPGCLVLTAGVDVQDDRLEVQVVGWGAAEACWIVDHHVIPGRPSDPEPWVALGAYLDARFTNEHGHELRIETSAIDTGGHHTQAVYAFVRESRGRRCMAVKGATSPGRPVLGKPSWQDVNYRGVTVKKGVALYMVGTDTAKHLLYGRLDADGERSPEDRRVRFSQELPEAWFGQLVSEAFNPRKNRWEIKKGKRNEALDCWVYALAASHHPELYLHKWRPADWQRRARMLGERDLDVAAGDTDAAQAEVAERPPTPAPRASGGKISLGGGARFGGPAR